MAFDHSQLALDLHLCHSLSQSNGTVSGPGRSRTKKRESLPPIFTEPKGQEEFITPQPGDLESLICRQMQTHPLTCTIEHSDPCKHTLIQSGPQRKEFCLLMAFIHVKAPSQRQSRPSVCFSARPVKHSNTHTHQHTLYRHKEKWHDTFLFTTECRLANLPPFPPLYQLSSIWLLPSDSTAESAFHLTVQKKVRLLQTEISGWRDALSIALILR